MSACLAVESDRVEALYRRERASFESARPRSAAIGKRARQHLPSGVPMAWMAGFYDHPVLYVDWGRGAWFSDVDGHRFLDI
jgi:glutamate-1-semialdehyde 2,1-aminomutase